MGRKFKSYPMDEPLLLPPDLNEWVPEDHLARFIREAVSDKEVQNWHQTYESGGGRGQPPYPPVMMARILVYCYCTGRFSSRKIAQATYEDVAVRFLAADCHPDYTRISEFRRRHYSSFEELFQRVVKLARKLELVSLGHVALDGTKLQGNAARRKSVDDEKLAEMIKDDEELVKRLLEQARLADEADEEAETKLPTELATAEARLKRLKAAKEQLDREAQAKADQERLAAEAADEKYAQQSEPIVSEGEWGLKDLREQHELTQKQLAECLGVLRQVISQFERFEAVPTREQLDKLAERLGVKPDQLKVLVRKRRKKPGRKRVEKPKGKQRINLTDSDSRLMKPTNHDTSIQGFNAQLGVDSECQIVVAATVTNETTDYGSFKPLITEVDRNCGARPKKVSADAGYCSAKNLQDEGLADIDLYVATGKHRKLRELPPNEKSEARRAMREKLDEPSARAIYNQRGAIVEPVNAHIKNCMGFKRFSMRGLAKVQAEWFLVTTAHNLLKIFRAVGLAGLIK